jgi:hypothetical protein
MALGQLGGDVAQRTHRAPLLVSARPQLTDRFPQAGRAVGTPAQARSCPGRSGRGRTRATTRSSRASRAAARAAPFGPPGSRPRRPARLRGSVIGVHLQVDRIQEQVHEVLVEPLAPAAVALSPTVRDSHPSRDASLTLGPSIFIAPDVAAIFCGRPSRCEARPASPPARSGRGRGTRPRAPAG